MTAAVEETAPRNNSRRCAGRWPSCCTWARTPRTRGATPGEPAGDAETGVRCAGAPVSGHTGAVTCAVSIPGPFERITAGRVPEQGALVFASAAEVSGRLGARR